jgi:hypothetical protein
VPDKTGVDGFGAEVVVQELDNVGVPFVDQLLGVHPAVPFVLVHVPI